MPLLTTPKRAGMVKGLAIVKRRRSEGSVAKSLSIEIVRVVFALLFNNARAFLQECRCAQASSPRAASRGPRWAEMGLSFSWKIEIAFHFNTELNFDN